MPWPWPPPSPWSATSPPSSPPLTGADSAAPLPQRGQAHVIPPSRHTRGQRRGQGPPGLRHLSPPLTVLAAALFAGGWPPGTSPTSTGRRYCTSPSPGLQRGRSSWSSAPSRAPFSGTRSGGITAHRAAAANSRGCCPRSESAPPGAWPGPSAVPSASHPRSAAQSWRCPSRAVPLRVLPRWQASHRRAGPELHRQRVGRADLRRRHGLPLPGPAGADGRRRVDAAPDPAARSGASPAIRTVTAC